MKKFLLVGFFLFGVLTVGTAQERSVALPSDPSLADVCYIFSKDYDIKFSFDADRLETILFDYDAPTITLNQFIALLASQYSVTVKEVFSGDFNLIMANDLVSFCGLVIDEFGDPLSSISIFQKNQVLAETDSLGRFTVQLPINTNITVYESEVLKSRVRVRNTGIDCPTIMLTMAVTQLEEVVVKDYLTKGMVKNEDSSIKLSPKGLGMLPGFVEPDIFQSLQRIPGVNSPTEDPTNLFIRGGTPDQNLILYDGIKMYLNDHFFKQISSYNPYIIKDANVYRGGTSVKYGDRISGVVDIRSADDVFDKLKVGGGINLTSADAYVKIPLSDNFGILLAGRRSSTDLYKTFTYAKLAEKVFQNSRQDVNSSEPQSADTNPFVNYFFSDINFKTIWKPKPGHRLQLSLIHIANELRTANNVTETSSSLRLEDLLIEKNLGIGFSWVNNKPGKTRKAFEAYFSSYSSDYAYDWEFNSEDGSTLITTNRFNRIVDIGYDISFDIPLNETQSLLLGQQSTVKGIDLRFSEDVESDFLETPFKNNTFLFNELLDFIAYSEYKFRSDDVYLSLGLRAGLYNNFRDFLLEPRVYASKNLTDKLRITASAEIKNQSFSQFYLPQEGGNLVTSSQVANSIWGTQSVDGFDVAILRSRQFTIGALYDYNGWLLELEGYYKGITNALPYDDNFIPNLYQIQERDELRTGTGSRIGMDILLKKRFRNYRIWLSYAYSINNNKFADVQTDSFYDSYGQRHNLNISQTYSFKKFEFGLGFSASSGLPFTAIGQGTREELDLFISENEINNERLPTYHRWDVSALYNFQLGEKLHGRIGLSARNIINRRIPIKLDYSLTSSAVDDTVIQANERQSLGFIGDLVFRINF